VFSVEAKDEAVDAAAVVTVFRKPYAKRCGTVRNTITLQDCMDHPQLSELSVGLLGQDPNSG